MSDVKPLTANPAAFDFLMTRRSRPPKMLGTRAPQKEELLVILEAALRVPDHGKLEPWRLIVLTGASLARLADLTLERGAELGNDPDKLAKNAATFRDTPMVVAVVSSPKASDKIPLEEQQASAAALCFGVTNAALARGWGASWLTAWMASDEVFLTRGLGLLAGEKIAGFIHIGDEARVPQDRPRPRSESIVSWVDT